MELDRQFSQLAENDNELPIKFTYQIICCRCVARRPPEFQLLVFQPQGQLVYLIAIYLHIVCHTKWALHLF